MVVSGLNASTTYYFAIKTSDEVPNTSAISNSPSGTTTAVTGVTTLSIVEKDGVTTNNYPVTLSLGFKQGDVASHVTVRANGVDLPTQTDVKVRWPDNSVRHAMVSFIIPQLQASQTQSIEIRTGGTNQNSTWMSTSDLLATDFQALMAIVSGGQTQNASARAILQSMAQPEYWLKGSICTEFIIRNFDTRYFSQLNVSYRVRVYPTSASSASRPSSKTPGSTPAATSRTTSR